MSQQCKVWIDKNLIQSTKGVGELLTHLEKANTATIIEKLPVENSIFWTRCNSTLNKEDKNKSTEEQHDHILVKLELETLIDYLIDFNSATNVNDNLFANFVCEIKISAQVTYITLLVQNFKSFMKNASATRSAREERENYNDLVKINRKAPKSKSKQGSLTKSEINQVIMHLELRENVCIRSYETGDELRDLVLSYTKAVSEYTQKHTLAENMIFCDKALEKSQNKVSKDGQGLINLWKDLLECFPLVSCDQAQAICVQYPSPFLLKRAYETSDKPEMLLADIQVRRGAGVLSSVRRIGPELSQKLFKFFNTGDGEELLVNE